MVFEILLLVGLIGFVAMAGMGFLHGSGGHGHGDSGHHGGVSHDHHIGVHHGHSHGHLHDAAHHGPNEAHVASHWGLAKLLPFLSPLNLFSMALGAGATGMLLQAKLIGPPLVLAAVVGALVFDLGIVRPMMTLMIRFGSTPSEGLEGTIASFAEAVTPFDSQGKGLVRLTLDGQIVQILGCLDSHEKSTVRKGDRLVVTEVDATRGMCKVTKELSED